VVIRVTKSLKHRKHKKVIECFIVKCYFILMAEVEKDLLNWQFPEYQEHHHSKRWWTVFGVIGIALMLFAILNGNFLFALILIMVAAIIIFRHYHEAEEVTFRATEQGIEVDSKFYQWRDIKSFWLAYEPPQVKTLILEFNSSLRPHMSIALQEQNPLEVRDILGEYIEEDLERESEPTSDALGRILKL